MLKAPCKDCPDRHIGCHGDCEKYKDFRKRQDDFIAKRKKLKNEENDWYRSLKRGHTK